MAITKQYLKSKPICKVTFSVPAEDAKKVAVVGNFNAWNPKKNPLKKLKNGNFKGTIDLAKDNSYEFKYVVDGEWQNEAQADGFATNEFAEKNSVISL